jgi:hypothetical protein
LIGGSALSSEHRQEGSGFPLGLELDFGGPSLGVKAETGGFGDSASRFG